MIKLDRVIWELQVRGYDFEKETLWIKAEGISSYGYACGKGPGFFFSDSGGGPETMYIVENPSLELLKTLRDKIIGLYTYNELKNIEILPEERFTEKTLNEYVDSLIKRYSLNFVLS